MLEAHECIRVRKRQWFDQDAVDDRKDGRGGADAEREGEGGDEGESWRPTEGAHAVANVLQRILKEDGAELVPSPFLDAFDTTKLRERASPSVLRRQTGAPMLLRLLIDVKADLLIEAPFENALVRQRP